MGLRAAASIIKERLRLSSKDLMTALGSGQRNRARPSHTIFLSAIWFFDSLNPAGTVLQDFLNERKVTDRSVFAP